MSLWSMDLNFLCIRQWFVVIFCYIYYIRFPWMRNFLPLGGFISLGTFNFFKVLDNLMGWAGLGWALEYWARKSFNVSSWSNWLVTNPKDKHKGKHMITKTPKVKRRKGKENKVKWNFIAEEGEMRWDDF